MPVHEPGKACGHTSPEQAHRARETMGCTSSVKAHSVHGRLDRCVHLISEPTRTHQASSALKMRLAEPRDHTPNAVFEIHARLTSPVRHRPFGSTSAPEVLELPDPRGLLRYRISTRPQCRIKTSAGSRMVTNHVPSMLSTWMTTTSLSTTSAPGLDRRRTRIYTMPNRHRKW